MILDLKNFNTFATKTKFKMETLQHILHLVQPQMWMTSIDLQDTFLVIPIQGCHQGYLRFTFDWEHFLYIVLLFGYTGSPRIFSKVLKEVISKLRTLGFIITFYLDNSWQGGSMYKECLDTCIATYSLLTQCGFIPNLKKSKLVPAQKIEILGVLLDSVNMVVTLPDCKIKQTLDMINTVLSAHHMSIRDLTRLIGKLLSCTVS